MLLFNYNVATPSIFLFSNRECYADQKCSGFIFSILSIYRVINCEYIFVLILIFARYQKFKIFKTRIKMFAEFTEKCLLNADEIINNRSENFYFVYKNFSVIILWSSRN